MSRDRAAYMRAYRAKRAEREAVSAPPPIGKLLDRIAELEAEVHRLKQELALRAPRVMLPDIDRFGVARPAPKPSQRK